MLRLAIVAWYGLAFLGASGRSLGPMPIGKRAVAWWSGWRRRALRQELHDMASTDVDAVLIRLENGHE